MVLDLQAELNASPVAGETATAVPRLAGMLDDFRAFDICQLLGMTGASGVLHLSAAGVRGEIFVDQGQVVGAWARPNPRRLGSLLRVAQAVDEETLQAALQEQVGDRGARLGEILRRRGALDDGQLEQALTQQAEASLTALLILPAGRFTFDCRALPASFQRLAVDPQGLVLDALTRIDELRGGLRRS